MARVDGVDVMVWPIPNRVGTPNTAFLVPATAVLETNCLYLHNRRIDPRVWGLILFSRSMAMPPVTPPAYSISLLASIPLDAGSDMENLALKVPILLTFYLGQSWNCALETCQTASLGTRASSNFLEENEGSGNESGDSACFGVVHF
ncbi:hypothetical protein K438DRAFT_1768139 [Mycena galopus ATCC 62051]|nr:hypothetical protein K438DRAFT_1768139 [Mycena galopus ATCC 62051]